MLWVHKLAQMDQILDPKMYFWGKKASSTPYHPKFWPQIFLHVIFGYEKDFCMYETFAGTAMMLMNGAN